MVPARQGPTAFSRYASDGDVTFSPTPLRYQPTY